MRKIFFASAFALIGGIAHAQTSTSANSYISPQTVGPNAIQLTTSPGTYVTLYTGASQGSKCYGGVLNTNDQGASHLVTFRLTLNSVANDYATYTTVSGGAAHTLGTPVNIMSSQIIGSIFPVDQQGNQYFTLKSGDLWRVTFATAITASDSINIEVFCEDFK